jgi:hypothetical protein
MVESNWKKWPWFWHLYFIKVENASFSLENRALYFVTTEPGSLHRLLEPNDNRHRRIVAVMEDH